MSKEAERWQQVEVTLTAVLEVTTGQRASVLDRLCAGQPELRREVESLLLAHTRSGGFLAGTADDFAAPYLGDTAGDAGDTAGTVIGRYRLLEEIGRGGMGAVWLAERADGAFEHRVALKLIKRGMDSDEILARFLRERQILARLQHPNIARLLDGGVSEDGRPYFVMEHVPGVPITRFADARALGIEERLRLFADVCRAVQFAHRNLVVHRDLKPSNVLVTESSEVRLLDFGVARLLGDSDEAALTGARGPLTPEYASPEQLDGRPVTTASDVYQLGLLLYELLAGRRPRQADGTLQETTVTRPSAAVGRPAKTVRRDGSAELIEPEVVSRHRSSTPDRLRRRLRGDLDAMTLRALRPEPDQRHPSAEALADDIERHLAWLPIRYGGGGWVYATRRFLRRHRLGVAATTLVALAGLGFGALFVSRIRAERDRARREAVKAAEAGVALTRVFRGWNPNAADRGRVSADLLLGNAARRARLELGHEPDVLAATLSMLGDLHAAIGQGAAADSLLSAALAVQRRLPRSSRGDLAVTLTRKGWLQLRDGRAAEAEESLEEALGIYAELRDKSGPEHARAQLLLAQVLRDRGRLAEAEAMVRAALLGLPESQRPLRTEISALLGYLLFLQARYPEAVEILRPTLDEQRRIFGSLHHSTLAGMRGLAAALRGPGAIAEAEALDREALNIARTLYGEDHPETAGSVLALAVLLERKGDFVAADSFGSRAAVTPLREYGELHDRTALALRTLGGIRLVLRRQSEAEALLRRALAGLDATYPLGHPDHGDILNRLAFLALARSKPDADSIYARAVRFEQARRIEDPFFVTDGYEYLGSAALELGDLELAERLYRRAVTLYAVELPAGHPYLAQSLTGLGETLLAAGRSSEAEPYLREGLANWRASRLPAEKDIKRVLGLLRRIQPR